MISTKKVFEDKFPNIKGYKKIGAEEYKILEIGYDEKPGFGSFPTDGIWLVHSKQYSKSSSLICNVKKIKELPELYPLVDLSLRKDDISTAILRFAEQKNKSLLEIGQCNYSANELSEFIIRYLVSQELGGGSKKILVEKKWIQVNNEFEENKYRNNF